LFWMIDRSTECFASVDSVDSMDRLVWSFRTWINRWIGSDTLNQQMRSIPLIFVTDSNHSVDYTVTRFTNPNKPSVDPSICESVNDLGNRDRNNSPWFGVIGEDRLYRIVSLDWSFTKWFTKPILLIRETF
jgi:hypothetical protein